MHLHTVATICTRLHLTAPNKHHKNLQVKTSYCLLQWSMRDRRSKPMATSVQNIALEQKSSHQCCLSPVALTSWPQLAYLLGPLTLSRSFSSLSEEASVVFSCSLRVADSTLALESSSRRSRMLSNSVTRLHGITLSGHEFNGFVSLEEFLPLECSMKSISSIVNTLSKCDLKQ